MINWVVEITSHAFPVILGDNLLTFIMMVLGVNVELVISYLIWSLARAFDVYD